MTERDAKPKTPPLSNGGGADPSGGESTTAPAKGTPLASRGRRLLRHVLVFITVLIVVDAIAGEKGLLALLQARREYSALERSLERARTENAELREMARRLREEPNAIEEQARRELGLIKPGEMLFIIKDIEKKP
jgi:cell division protein FtsB